MIDRVSNLSKLTQMISADVRSRTREQPKPHQLQRKLQTRTELSLSLAEALKQRLRGLPTQAEQRREKILLALVEVVLMVEFGSSILSDPSANDLAVRVQEAMLRNKDLQSYIDTLAELDIDG